MLLLRYKTVKICHESQEFVTTSSHNPAIKSRQSVFNRARNVDGNDACPRPTSPPDLQSSALPRSLLLGLRLRLPMTLIIDRPVKQQSIGPSHVEHRVKTKAAGGGTVLNVYMYVCIAL